MMVMVMCANMKWSSDVDMSVLTSNKGYMQQEKMHRKMFIGSANGKELINRSQHLI